MTTTQTHPLQIGVATIHPAFIEAYLTFGVVKAAVSKGVLALDVINLRDFAVDRHGSIDDMPYGGGDGMVLRPEPLAQVVKTRPQKPRVILTSPAGRPWDAAEAERLSQSAEPLLLLCGRFGGVDQRFIDRYVDDEFSMGDYVVSGGELAVLTMLDSMTRFLPGALGNAESAAVDSFGHGLGGMLEHPLYTRPVEFEGVKVPDVLLSGNHEAIRAWRAAESRRITEARRPDLLPRKK